MLNSTKTKSPPYSSLNGKLKAHEQNPNPNSTHPPRPPKSSSFLHSPPHISQILTQFLVSGQRHDPFLTRHFIKHLMFSLSPHLAVFLFAFLPTLVHPSPTPSSSPSSSTLTRRSSRLFLVTNSSVCSGNFIFPLRAKLLSYMVLVQNGKLLHAQIVKLGFEEDLHVQNSAIHTYVCFGDLDSAWKLFEGFVEEVYLVTWKSMIDWYVKNRMVEAA
ncbi:uncharacterized protein A4U43_C01F12290 [Asparagus officinalis]|uniref:Pentatricopeptide repeat-containing protein n=1 Tax=Asparagus officinalis TaxID=4686 RepID=A0A5P1FTB6_ASPOF|nr:uncharacterized protein A4U43_C01F12290 [Asparagus officinalis]